MDWDWTRVRERFDDSRVVRQLHEYGCGAACAVMLFADRGVELDQLTVATRLPLPCTAARLAEFLNAFSTRDLEWVGGHLDLDPPLERRHIEAIGWRGSWAAQLIPRGYRDGHWVVIDGMSEDETVAVRDPAGSSYHLPFFEFADLMHHMVAVFETGENS